MPGELTINTPTVTHAEVLDELTKMITTCETIEQSYQYRNMRLAERAKAIAMIRRRASILEYCLKVLQLEKNVA